MNDSQILVGGLYYVFKKDTFREWIKWSGPFENKKDAREWAGKQPDAKLMRVGKEAIVWF